MRATLSAFYQRQLIDERTVAYDWQDKMDVQRCLHHIHDDLLQELEECMTGVAKELKSFGEKCMSKRPSCLHVIQ